jgi:thiol-disulfide isomerase/thioredoxin
MIDRRSVFAGTAAALAGTLAGASARAAMPDTPLFTSGPMAQNHVAALFRAPGSPLSLPDTPLLSAHGPQKLSELRGRTYIVSLWGEWCAPCLEEATDLATLNRKHGGPSFGVIFVLTSSFKKLDLRGAKAVLAGRHADDAPLFIEPHGGAAVMNAMANQVYGPEMRAALKKDGGAGLPCNLLVDRYGQVRGRAFGAPSEASFGPSGHTLTEADHARILTSHTTWATPAGDEFAAALAAGVLDKA